MAVKSVPVTKELSPFAQSALSTLRRAGRSKATIIGGIMVLLIVLMSIFAPQLSPHDPAIQFDDGLQYGVPWKPFDNPKFPLGTDHLGRDVLSRILYGSRISLSIGLFSMAFATIIGLFLGVNAGYYGGVVDMAVMRFTDVIMAFPSFLLTMATVSSLKPSLWSLLFSISIVRWAGTARLARAQALSLKEMEYVTAAKAIGVKDRRILGKYILPNSFAPIVVNMTMGIAGAILVEASLSYLGLGVQPPIPSWGMMINEARTYMFLRPSLLFIPSFCIAFAVLGFSILGDGLRDVLDPRLRGT